MTGLSVRGLTLAAGTRVYVEDVSFSAPAGGVTAVLGLAGAGKTLLLAGIAGLVPPRRGAVFVDGTEVTRRRAGTRPGQRGIGLLAPGTDLGAGRKLLAALRHTTGRAGAGVLPGLMDALALTPLADARLDSLTHGQGFAALVAARLARPGTVLLVDDAGTGLDSAARDGLHAWLWQQAEDGRTVVFATRDRGLALAADTLVLLQEGRVVQAGAPASLYAEPRDPAAATLTGAANLLRGVVRQKMPGGFIWAAANRKYIQTGPAATLAPPSLGGHVHLCLRPEQIGLVAPETAGNTLPGRVARVTCLGGRTETSVQTDLGLIKQHSAGPARWRPGELVTLGWAADAAWRLADPAPVAQPTTFPRSTMAPVAV